MKKDIILFFISLGLILIGVGCGGGSNSNLTPDNPDNNDVSINMVVGKTYTIKKGQTITKRSDPSIVEINTDTQTGITTAVLKSGSAKIK